MKWESGDRGCVSLLSTLFSIPFVNKAKILKTNLDGLRRHGFLQRQSHLRRRLVQVFLPKHAFDFGPNGSEFPAP